MQELLELALENEHEATRVARRVLAESDDRIERSYAHQALGIVLRDQGELADALTELRIALRDARAADSPDREADVRATYGVTLALGGRTKTALAELERASATATGEVAAKVRFRHAVVLGDLGRNDEARNALQIALGEFIAAGDEGWEARSRVWLGHLELRMGNVASAEGEIVAAARIFRRTGFAMARLTALQNIAEIAVARGNLAEGLRRFAEAAHDYETIGLDPRFELVRLHAGAYLAAGLADLAVDLLEHFDEVRISAFHRAQFHLVEATAQLASGDPGSALDAAVKAREMFRQQRRDWFHRRALLQEVRADFSLGGRGRTREARDVALALDEEQADEAPIALTLAGRLTTAEERLALWRRAATYRTRPNGLVRAAAFVAGALASEESDDRGGVLRACSAGLDAIDEHRRLMGSSELRALATTHGRELTEIALRHAAHDPRTLLRWSERTRATALAQPPATSDAATIPAPLAALRDNGRRLAEARQGGEPTEDLEKERLRLERAVRTESHTQSAADTDPQRPASVREIVAGVGDGCLVELVDVDGTLHVLVVHDGRVRRRVAGATAEVNDLLAPAGMLLRRAARGRHADTADLGRRLQQSILGDAARLIPDGPVVLAPTARLHGLAWSLLPALHDRPFSVVPSAGQWLRATNATRPRQRRTVLVAGPDLESGGAEVPILASKHPDAALLDNDAATLAAVLEHLDGADLAHLATHGRFRADSPLFSALDLADGPLTVHDLERLRRAPYRVVLSACESGVLAPVGSQELLGLAAALFSIGTAGLVCSVAEVNDRATAELMVRLHDALAHGKDPAAALHDVRQASAADPVAAGTAAAFLALGV